MCVNLISAEQITCALEEWESGYFTQCNLDSVTYQVVFTSFMALIVKMEAHPYHWEKLLPTHRKNTDMGLCTISRIFLITKLTKYNRRNLGKRTHFQVIRKVDVILD